MRMSRITEALKGRLGPRWLPWVPTLAALLFDLVPLLVGLQIAVLIFTAFAGRLVYPYDLEWMEGGMLAHAWRVQAWMPLYAEPGPDWVPYIYPPGYPALLAALSPVTGLSAGLGRAVSVFGTLLTCGALVFGAWRHTRSTTAGLLGAFLFLSCYPDTGAFYDLVRPDALAVGLLAWSVVLGIDTDRRARLVAGFLLAVAFSVKHNTAAYGVPMALGIAVRFGLVEALLFGLASAGPALLFTGILQIASGGHFITTLLGIARAHPMVMGRFLPGAVEELGKHVGPAVLACSVAFAAFTVQRTKGNPERGVVAAASVLMGIAILVAGMALPAAERMPQPAVSAERMAWGAIGIAIGAVVAGGFVWPSGRARVVAPLHGLLSAPLLWWLAPQWTVEVGIGTVPWVVGMSLAVGAGFGLFAAALQRRLDGAWQYGAGIAFIALLTAGLMRGHHGGFLNVYIPLHFVLALSTAIALGLSRTLWPRVEVFLLGAALLTGQLWMKRDFAPARYVPTAEDVAAGDAFVEALEACEGPVLSPFNPWLPVLAGHAPSFHLIALWDINHKSGPYFAQMADIRAAAEAHHWDCVVSGSGRPLGFGIQKNYRVWETPPVPRTGPRPGGGPPTFMPRTGWRVRPKGILIPIER